MGSDVFKGVLKGILKGGLWYLIVFNDSFHVSRSEVNVVESVKKDEKISSIASEVIK